MGLFRCTVLACDRKERRKPEKLYVGSQLPVRGNNENNVLNDINTSWCGLYFVLSADVSYYEPLLGKQYGIYVYHRCSSCRWVKRQPGINLLYEYLFYLYRTYKRTSAWRFAGCWLNKVSLLLGSLCMCLHLWVCLSHCESCCYICCSFSRSYSYHVVDTLPYCSFSVFCWTISMETRTVAAETRVASLLWEYAYPAVA
jgi:hypothetical protein